MAEISCYTQYIPQDGALSLRRASFLYTADWTTERSCSPTQSEFKVDFLQMKPLRNE